MLVSSGRFSRKVICVAVASACTGAAFAAPVGPVVGAGSASYAPATLTVTSTSARTQIGWQSFNVAANEVVRFVQPSAQSSVLNQVFAPQALNILGSVTSNGSVMFLSNGIVSGSGMNLDLAGVINTSLRFSQRAPGMSGMASAMPPRPLTTLADGRIYVIGQDDQALTAVNGDVVLNPGRSIELADASMPHLRVVVAAPRAEAISLSRLVAGKGTGIYAGLFRAPAAARRAGDGDADAVLTAAADDYPTLTPSAERFYRYALIYAELRREALHDDEGGLMKVAAASRPTVMAAAKSRPSLLPRDIVIGTPAERQREAIESVPGPVVPAMQAPEPGVAAVESERETEGATVLALGPAPQAVDPATTLESRSMAASAATEREDTTLLSLALAPQSVEPATMLESGPIAVPAVTERADRTLLSLAPPPQAVEQVATQEPRLDAVPAASERGPEPAATLALAAALPAVQLLAAQEPQPIAPAAEGEQQPGGAKLKTVAAALPAAEPVATLEPQPIAVAAESAREGATLLALASAEPASPALSQPEPDLSLAGGLEVDPAQGRYTRRSAPPVVVMAMAHPPAPASSDDSKTREIRVERQAPRYFTDHRGAMFFM
jgi:filamentous hemagglutinin family protein